MNELILIRHGQSEHHLTGGPGGWSLSPLTALGRSQAVATARRLKDRPPFEISAVIASDLPRAAETAAIIAAGLGMNAESAPALRELNNGVAARLTKDEARRVANPPTEPALDWVPYPQAESWRAMYRRVAAFLSTLRAEGRDRLVLVSHANAIVCAINWFLGLDSDENLTRLAYEIRPCSLTHLRLDADNDQSRTVVRLNDVEHLLSL